MRTIKDRLWRLKQSMAATIDRREKLHFLHIGKNAGTQIKVLARHVNETSKTIRIVSHHHNVRLFEIPSSDPFFFAIRHPAERFKSGFYSRKRKGQPLIYKEWTEHEARAFSEFEHANDLAEALFEDGRRGFDALCAMKSISHCSMNQINWFDRSGYFLEVREPIWIIRQERFHEDMERLAREIGVNFAQTRKTDANTAHRNDYSGIPPLSDKARRNLRDWYRQDFEFYRCCEDWLRSHEMQRAGQI
jgi:hypothetical protein